jgi:hypothetical protein
MCLPNGFALTIREDLLFHEWAWEDLPYTLSKRIANRGGNTGADLEGQAAIRMYTKKRRFIF